MAVTVGSRGPLRTGWWGGASQYPAGEDLAAVLSGRWCPSSPRRHFAPRLVTFLAPRLAEAS